MGCRQTRILEKTTRLEFLAEKEGKIQTQAQRGVLQKQSFKKLYLKCSSSGNVVKILQKYI